MAVLKVRKYGDPMLRKRAAPVESVTPELRKIIDDMVETMFDEVGIGLAAPQVGISLRLMVISDDQTGDARAILNPVITAQGGQVTAEEGCLSVPGVFAPVTRAEWVTMQGQDVDGQSLSIDARGMRARVLQHEIDHLDGILFIDRLDPVVRDRVKRKIKKEGLPEEVRHRAFAL
jgi:peptide deformylase